MYEQIEMIDMDAGFSGQLKSFETFRANGGNLKATWEELEKEGSLFPEI